MGFYPFEVTAPHLVYTLLGGFTVVFGMFSAFIKEKLYLGEAPIATVFGIILGPHVSGLIDPYKWGGSDDDVRDEITLEVTRVVIAISVFAAGVELPKAYMLRHWRTMIVLLGPAMLWGWFISALFMWGLFPRLSYLSCLVIAAAVTPTDPILAQSVIGGKFADKHVPAHVRHMLSAESGSNDGAAFPFMYIALYLTLDASPGHAVGEWFYATIAYEIILGTVLGGLLGFTVRKVMQFAERKNYIDRQSFVAQYVSLALLSTGGTVLLGSDDLLSAFACGCAFAWDGYFNQQTEDAVFSNVVDLLFNCAAFIYIGALLPFPEFNDHELGLDWWRLVVLAICILVARRLPAILAMYKLVPDIKTFREAAFTGWFGPMGVGAVFISTLARHELPEGNPEANTEQVDHLREVISPIVLFIVLSSVLTHGLSIPFFSLGRRVHSLTYTWSRNPSMRDNAPAWTTHTRQVRPGEAILINRDEEDNEAGDIGLRRTRTGDDNSSNEKRLDSSQSGGSGSDTLAEGARKRHGYSYSDNDRDAEEGSRGEEGNGRGTGSDGDSLERQEDENDASGERAARDDGGRTPPVAEYREGDDLIIERQNKETGELDVQVVKHHFREDKPARVHQFSHSESLEHNRGMLASILPTLERWASNKSLNSIKRQSRPGTPSPQHREEDEEIHRPSGSGAVPIPGIQIDEASGEKDDEGVKRQDQAGKPSLRSRWFGRRSSSPGKDDMPMTERSSHPNRPHIHTTASSSSSRSQGAAQSQSESQPRSQYTTGPNFRPNNNPNSNPSGMLSPIAGSPLDLTRTTSINRTIRFAPDSAPSSDTVPGPIGAPNTGTGDEERANYGNAQSGFKRTPGLAMFRTTSIKEDE